MNNLFIIEIFKLLKDLSLSNIYFFFIDNIIIFFVDLYSMFFNLFVFKDSFLNLFFLEKFMLEGV